MAEKMKWWNLTNPFAHSDAKKKSAKVVKPKKKRKTVKINWSKEAAENKRREAAKKKSGVKVVKPKKSS